jgi:MFS family permease
LFNSRHAHLSLDYDRSTSRRLLYTLFIAQSLFSASQIAIIALVTIVAVRIAGTESVAGLPGSTVTFAQAFAAYPLSLVMGRLGRRPGLALGYLSASLGGLVGMIAISNGIFPLLLVSSALTGIARAGADQGRFAAGEMFPEAERARMIGRLVFAGTVGAVVGPVLVTPSGNLLSSVGLDPDLGPWAASMVLCGLSAILTFFFLRPDPMFQALCITELDRRTQADPPNVSATVRSLGMLLRLPKVQLAVLAIVISQSVMTVLMAMTPLHMDHHNHGRDAISLVISLHALGMFGLSPFTGYLIDRFGRIQMLLIGALLLAVSAVLAPLSSEQNMLVIALFLLGVGWNLGYVSGSSLLADALAGEERARVQGVNDSLVFFVAGFGSIGAGLLFASSGFFAVCMIGLALVVVLMGLMVWYSRPVVPAVSG